MKNMKILMVCTGNICLSPMAEGIARALLKAAKRDDISVDSAATHAYHTGDAPDPRARPFIAEDFAAFDLILVADRGHYRHLSALAPDEAAHAKIGFMLDTLPENPGAELPDPYYGESADFERTFTLLEAALRARFA